MNKKGQIDSAIAFIIVVVLLVMMAPFLLKVVLEPIDKTITAYAGIDSSNKSVEASTYIRTKFVGMWDWVVMAVFIFSIALLLITSFLVDVHPAFLIVYIIACFCMLSFAPSVLDFLDHLYNDPAFTTLGNGTDLTTYLPLTKFVYDNFAIVIVIILALSAIIMYGKYRFGGGGQSSGTPY